MSIDHLEHFCQYKSLTYDKTTAKPNSYTFYKNDAEPTDAREAALLKNNFDDPEKRLEYTLAQLRNIGNHLNDFNEVVANCEQY